jgi:hypothetical protein
MDTPVHHEGGRGTDLFFTWEVGGHLGPLAKTDHSPVKYPY